MGGLSPQDIEKLVKDAEKYKSEDEAMRKKVENKNAYENMIYQIRSTVNDEKVSQNLSAEDKETLDNLTKSNQEWLDSHPDASVDEYDSKIKEMEKVFQPIMSKFYQSGNNMQQEYMN